MNELEGLLDDIRQNPEDDTPRLVAADWYEEHGDPVRAGYIRDSVALERLPDWDRSPLEERRLQALLAKHGKGWLGDLRRFGRVEWERGFPRAIDLKAGQFLKHADAITRHFRNVSLNAISRSIRPLAECAALSRLRSLTLLGSGQSSGSWPAFFASPHLAGLRDLELEDCDLPPVHFDSFAEASFLPRLERLSLNGVSLTPDCLRRLDARHFRRLSISHADLEGEELDQLRELAGLAGLTHLTLTYSLAESSGPALARWNHLHQLTHLNLHFGTLHHVGAEALAGSALLSNLRELRIGFHEIRNRGIEALLQSHHLRNLEVLDLCHSEATTILGRHLARWPGLANVRDLSLYYNGLRDGGLKTLLASPHVSNLRILNVSHCELTKEAGSLLGGCERLAGLKRLTLWGNELGDRGATALIRSPHLQQLESLDVTGDTFSKRGHARLKAHFGERYLGSD